MLQHLKRQEKKNFIDWLIIWLICYWVFCQEVNLNFQSFKNLFISESEPGITWSNYASISNTTTSIWVENPMDF